ncbi:S1 RNA-binding domain-containing protein [Candidatus Microgenomates bacterium]|nr:S1 RNA-binding domain-containing protein [Candidatus Microgenomates bacterium]
MAKSFAQIFEKNQPLKRAPRGSVIEAKILQITSNHIIADIGGKSEGIVTGINLSENREFAKTLKTGDSVQVLVTNQDATSGLIQVSLKPASAGFVWTQLENAHDKKTPVKTRVTEKTRGGLEVEVMGINSFIPNSQLGRAIQNGPDLVGRSITCLVLDANRDKNQLVLSERAISEKEEIERQVSVLSKLNQGEILDGKVVNVVPFGAFVEVTAGGTVLTGLVHKSEISWESLPASPARAGQAGSEELEPGQDVKVVVLGVKEANLSLSVKRAGRDPWQEAMDITRDSTIAGTIVRTNDRNIVVEVRPGIEGTISRSKIPVGASYQVGDKINCIIENIDLEKHRLSLSLQLTVKPIGYK